MDKRLYFVIGDIVANIATGALAGWVCWLLMPLGWHMLLAMVVAMVLGMLVALLLFPLFAYFWGAMEVMVPTMFSGMLSGMVVGMRATMMPLSQTEALFVGGAFGLAGIVIIWVLNNLLKGTAKPSQMTGGEFHGS